MIGENKLDGSAFQSVNCYSSTNLVEWTYVGALLTLQTSGDLGPSRVVERPKVIYNSNTQQYVMYMHIDSSSYGEAKVGVATSSSVCGSYTYRESFQPLGFQSRDMGLYKDDDGSAYLLTEDVSALNPSKHNIIIDMTDPNYVFLQRVNGLRIDKLSADYLSVASNVYTWAEKYEAPAVIKKNGVYFMFASQLTGWGTLRIDFLFPIYYTYQYADANDNKYSTATSLAGPWSAWANCKKIIALKANLRLY